MSTAIATPATTSAENFARFAWGVLGWNVAVVLWGAFVRASGSGAGCGNHWPLCNGEVVPNAHQVQTLIEFTHRVMSGIAFVAVGALVIWGLRRFPRGHLARKMAITSFVLLIVEALLGAGLVLFEYVGANGSAGRAFYLSLHLTNTLLLLAALALTAWYSREGNWQRIRLSPVAASALFIAVLISVTGAIAALGDTLFPAVSLREGLRQDLSGASHFLLRLRVLHPVFAVLGGFFFASIAVWKWRSSRVALALLALTIAQLCAGGINLVLLAPVWMQIVHLLLADLVWISLVLTAVEMR